MFSDFDFTNTPASPDRPNFNYQPNDSNTFPYVTIITPYYNTGSIFHETARSVFRQSFSQFEWLIINDGTNDQDANAILNEYRGIDPRVRIIDHAENLGLSAARNTGFREARTNYCVLLDSDDLIEPTAVEKWFWFLETHPEWSFVNGYSIGFGARTYHWENGFHNNQENLKCNQIDHTSMVRKSVHSKVGGFNETTKGGLEDWEFWIRCASYQYWGTTIPEYHGWYRTRTHHSDKWENLQEEKIISFQQRLKEQYPRLWENEFPIIQNKYHFPYEPQKDTYACSNELAKTGPRLLLIAPWFALGGAERFNLSLLEQLVDNGWEVTIVTTLNPDIRWLPEYAHFTPDIFVLEFFLDLTFYPKFIKYLIQSRRPDVLLTTNNVFGYKILPFIKSEFPDLPILDFVQAISTDWLSGGYPRLATIYQQFMDLNIVAAEQIKRWMVTEGADEKKIDVCYINIDSTYWRPDEINRKKVRRQLGIADDVTLIFYIARLIPDKQPNVAIKTFQRLYQEGARFAAAIIGDGPMLGWLKEFAMINGLENIIHFLGVLSFDDLHESMSAGDIIFLPSKSEGISLTFYEGMACGMIPVGSDVGAQRELVIPQCGILLPRSDDESEITQYAQVLFMLINDIEKRQQMSLACRRRVVEGFDIRQMGQRVIDLFQKAIKEHHENIGLSVDRSLGAIIAREAIESTRIERGSDYLWVEMDKMNREIERLKNEISVFHLPDSTRLILMQASIKTHIYYSLRRLFYYPYQWMMKKNPLLVGKVKDMIRGRLVKT